MKKSTMDLMISVAKETEKLLKAIDEMTKVAKTSEGLHEEARASRLNGQYSSYESFLEMARGFDQRLKGMVEMASLMTGVPSELIQIAVEENLKNS